MRLASPVEGGELLADARALEAAGVDGLWVDAADGPPYVVLAAVAAVTSRARLIAAGARDDAGRATCARFARGRLVVAEEATAAGERWMHVAFPAGRDAWREIKARAADDGVTGIVIPNDARLLDLLRNADQIDDRSDLRLATG